MLAAVDWLETTIARQAYAQRASATVERFQAARSEWAEGRRTDLFDAEDLIAWYLHQARCYRDEMKDGMLLQYPFWTTTQIPTNLVVGTNTDCSELYFVDFAECLILESRQMEFAISTEGTYTDANGVIQSAFQNDLTVIRAIMAEDFQMRHDEAIALDTGVRWAPAIQ